MLSTAIAEQIDFSVELAHPTLLKGEANKTYLKVGLTGFEFQNSKARPKTNIAIVIDKSGSMQGSKIERAKEAAITAISQLGPEDIVSVISYSDVIDVIIPATKITDKNDLIAKISQISADGGTALFAGVSKAGAEVKKFIDKNRVNRIVLLSDGQANVGPSSPALLGELAFALAKSGVAVTTIGLGQGYNENIMVAMAQQGEGNHYFVNQSSSLVATFKQEFGDLMSVCAKDIKLSIKLKDGVTCPKTWGRKAKIKGQNISYQFPRVYSKQEKYIILELDIDGSTELLNTVAEVNISYFNAQTNVTDQMSTSVNCRLSSDKAEVNKSANKEVIANAVEQISFENMAVAMKLRDAGKTAEAQKIFIANDVLIQQNVKDYNMKAKLDKFQFYNNAAQMKENSKQIQSLSYQGATNSVPQIPEFGIPVNIKQQSQQKK